MSDKERNRQKMERLREMPERDMQALAVAAIVGEDELARELQRVGLSHEDVAWAQPAILAAVEWTREERRPRE